MSYQVSTMSEQQQRMSAAASCKSSKHEVDPAVVLRQHSEALVHGLEVVLDHHDCPGPVQQSMREQVLQYLLSDSDIGLWFKRAKYVLAWPMSVYLRNERPPSPTGKDMNFRGIFGRWSRDRLKFFNRRNTHLWYSWLQAKRGADPVDQRLVEETYKKHLATLTSDDDGDEETITRIMENEPFKIVLEYTAKEVARLLRSLPRASDYSASTSASFQSRRSDGGQAQELRFRAGLPFFQTSRRCLTAPVLVTMRDIVGGYVNGRRQSVVVVSEYADDLDNEWRRLEEIPVINWATPAAVEPNLPCAIQAVLEPLKVRVISKGPATQYYQAKRLQVAMHSTLRQMPWFRLIGRPMSPTDLVDLANKASPGEKWISVDYSAATDGLSWKYSRRILDAVLSYADGEDRFLALKVLGPHRLFYPSSKKRGDYEERGLQRRGQLMGSILSFPILCLANLGVCLVAKHQSVPSDFLINGDDACYTASGHVYDEHKRIGKSVGLEMSVGKAYAHREYVNINSTCFHYRLDRPDTPWQIDFLNVGLIRGQGKVLSSDREERGTAKAKLRDDPESSITTNINRILEGSLPGRQCKLLALILKLHSKEILEETRVIVKVMKETEGRRRLAESFVTSRNLFLPKSVGGMGVRAPVGFKFEITRADKLLAKYQLKEKTFLLGENHPSGQVVRLTPYLPPWWNDQTFDEDRQISRRPPARETVQLLSSDLSCLDSNCVLRVGVTEYLGTFVARDCSDCYVDVCQNSGNLAHLSPFLLSELEALDLAERARIRSLMEREDDGYLLSREELESLGQI